MELKPLQGRLQGHRRHGARPRSASRRRSPPHLNFAIRPAGRGAPTIDPKPILDGWKLLETTAIYRAAGKNPFARQPDRRPGPADVEGGARAAGPRRPAASRSTPAAAPTSQTGQIDRRVLAVMEYLVAKGYRLTITSLKCGHCYPDHLGQRLARTPTATPVDIAAGQRDPDHRAPGPGHDHRGGDQGPAAAAGHDAAARRSSP